MQRSLSPHSQEWWPIFLESWQPPEPDLPPHTTTTNTNTTPMPPPSRTAVLAHYRKHRPPGLRFISSGCHWYCHVCFPNPTQNDVRDMQRYNAVPIFGHAPKRYCIACGHVFDPAGCCAPTVQRGVLSDIVPASEDDEGKVGEEVLGSLGRHAWPEAVRRAATRPVVLAFAEVLRGRWPARVEEVREVIEMVGRVNPQRGPVLELLYGAFVKYGGYLREDGEVEEGMGQIQVLLPED